ncbi:hypothetical protein J6590_027281, partial [Homalodisca vitripennis]
GCHQWLLYFNGLPVVVAAVAYVVATVPLELPCWYLFNEFGDLDYKQALGIVYYRYPCIDRILPASLGSRPQPLFCENVTMLYLRGVNLLTLQPRL